MIVQSKSSLIACALIIVISSKQFLACLKCEKATKMRNQNCFHVHVKCDSTIQQMNTSHCIFVSNTGWCGLKDSLSWLELFYWVNKHILLQGLSHNI